uniref:Transmembrane protein n=1 Tax=Pithovirus LCPAC304 TaxID=2506594 RepID=A0A481Z7T8_9VIRU|nr:MAG: hypothetical protein LCPAC304_03060 [Pithovirus LCPAC304]
MKYDFYYFVGIMCTLGGLSIAYFESSSVRDILHICAATLAWACEWMLLVVITSFVGFWILLGTSIGRLLGVRVYAERFLGWLAWTFVVLFAKSFVAVFVSEEELERG